MMRFKDIDKAGLRRLYVEDCLSSIELAKRYGVDSASILRWLQRIGVKRRSSGACSAILRKFSGYSKVDIDRMYHIEKMSQKEIGAKIGVSQTAIWRYFCRNNIHARSLIDERRARAKLKDLPDSIFVELYHKRKFGLIKLANRFGVYPETVRKEMMYRGIKVRSVHTCKPINIPVMNDLAYLTGVLAGDASIADGFSYRLAACDKEFVDYVDSILSKVSKTCRYVFKARKLTWRKQYMVILCRKKFVELISPVRFEDLTYRGKIRFIEGFMDSEGHVANGTTAYPRVFMHNNNRMLLEQISKFLSDGCNVANLVFPKADIGKCSCISIATKVGILRFRSMFRFSIKRKQTRLDSFFLTA